VPIEETPFFRLAARAQRDLRLFQTSRREPWLLWIKSRGVPSPWLAPRPFASRFLDIADEAEDEDAPLEDDDDPADEDPDEDESIDPEAEATEGESLLEMSAAEFDDLLRKLASLPADERERAALSDMDRGLMRRVFGGYVHLLDAGFGQLWDAIEQAAAASPTLLIVTAALGASVREPGVLRDGWSGLAEETLHTPLFVRALPTRRTSRRQQLVQPVDLLPTLFDWFGVDSSDLSFEGQSLLPLVRGQAHEPRSRIWCGDSQDLRGIRTPDYYLVEKNSGATADPLRSAVSSSEVHESTDRRRLPLRQQLPAQTSPDPKRDQQWHPADLSGSGPDDNDLPFRLFAKPEDIWEVNDLAPQRPDAVQELSAELDRFFAEG
jgi:arylsulfatase A-like enzyme